MLAENKRYLNDDNFTDASHHEAMVQKTPADEMILADTALHYRVVDPNSIGNNALAAHHKTIGGYHAAKLRRYNDLMENHIYDSISITDITNLAGVSRMAYYRTYNSKDEILIKHILDQEKRL